MQRFVMLMMGLALLLAPAAGRAQSPELMRREIDLLKRRLDAAQEELQQERTSRIVFETQIRVATLRGLPVGTPLAVAGLTREVLVELIEQSIEEQYPGAKFELSNWIYQYFGALPEDLDMRRFMTDLMEEQAGGLYDPKTKKLYVAPSFDIEGALGQMILAHEINHALQDQYFDLVEIGLLDSGNGDRSLAMLAAIEGDATLLMGEMTLGMNPLTVLADLPKMLMIDQRKLNAAPAVITESLLFPYTSGAAFYNQLRGRTRERPTGPLIGQASPSWRGQILADPPVSTEQVLHPEKYLAGELPAEIEQPTPPAGATGDIVHDVVGELGMRLILRETIDAERALAAAGGWNGDRILVAEAGDGSRRWIIWVTRWDSEVDAEEFHDALADALVARFGEAGLEWREADGGRAAEFPGQVIQLTRPDVDAVRLEVEIEWTGPAAESGA